MRAQDLRVCKETKKRKCVVDAQKYGSYRAAGHRAKVHQFTAPGLKTFCMCCALKKYLLVLHNYLGRKILKRSTFFVLSCTLCCVPHLFQTNIEHLCHCKEGSPQPVAIDITVSCRNNMGRFSLHFIHTWKSLIVGR